MKKGLDYSMAAGAGGLRVRKLGDSQLLTRDGLWGSLGRDCGSDA
ncbi:hypothetical protein [Paenibacillus silvestris]|nr:hypothetical protein [Paenibacillus silvestris]